MLAHAAGEPVQEPGLPDFRIEHGDRQPVGPQRLCRPAADGLHDRRKVELARQGLAHLVHDRELGNALAHLLGCSRAAQGRADVLADEGEYAHVVVRVELAGLIGLNDQDAERLVTGSDWNSEPVLAFGADILNLALGNQPLKPVVRHVLRHAGAQDVCRQARRPAGPERLPFIGVGRVFVHGIDEVGEADHLALLVVQRDVEVFAVREPADDLVDRRVELLQVPCRVRRLGDSIERRLDALLLSQRRRRSLQLRDPRLRGREGLGTAALGGTLRVSFHVAPHPPPPRSVNSSQPTRCVPLPDHANARLDAAPRRRIPLLVISSIDI